MYVWEGSLFVPATSALARCNLVRFSAQLMIVVFLVIQKRPWLCAMDESPNMLIYTIYRGA